MLPTLAAAFECPVGLSDHHAGEEMLLAAVALGASVLEKGLCLDRDVPDQDVPHALQASRLKSVLAACRKVHEALGSPMRRLRRDRARPVNRMGLVAARALSPGEMLDSRSLRFAFPALGIPVEHASLVTGWIVRRPVQKGAPVGWADLTPPER